MEQTPTVFKDSVLNPIYSDEFDTKRILRTGTYFIQGSSNRNLLLETREPIMLNLLFKLRMRMQYSTLLLYYRQQQSDESRIGYQNELNVEISDYGTKDAEDYFDDLLGKICKNY